MLTFPHPQPFSPREKVASSLSVGERVRVREKIRVNQLPKGI